MNYVKEFMKLSEREKKKMNWDDFFNKCKIPKKLRNDYLIGCILNKIVKKQMKGGKK